jgi:hypothetical protein
MAHQRTTFDKWTQSEAFRGRNSVVTTDGISLFTSFAPEEFSAVGERF